ncbi:MAG: acyl-CoA dehydrogenase family protein [Eubacterium sp.]|nr:acyl-CoA dehydrogenase family protein [Eubacterium sp.]
MEFRLNEDQEMLREMISQFAQKEIAPIAAELDENERFPQELIPQLGEMGIMGIPVPKEYGGSGLDHIAYAVAVEEVSKVCASTGVTISAHTSLGTWPIEAFGTKEQKEKYLPGLASGKLLGAFGLTEPNAGTDSAMQQTTAVDKGDYYLLNGSKIFITNGFYGDVYIIFAMTDKDAGNKGISAFILEKGMEGFTFGAKERKMGIRGSATYELIFDDVKVPKANLLGKEGQGFKIAMATLDGGRIGIAAQAVGIAQGAIDAAADYVQQRKQFGRPIGAFQNTQFTLADMQTRVDAARLLVHRAAAMKDAGESYTYEAATAKLFAAEVARDVSCQAVQLFGGYGYTKEYPVERMMRDAKITEIYEGTSEVQKMVIAGIRFSGKEAPKHKLASREPKTVENAPEEAAAETASANAAPTNTDLNILVCAKQVPDDEAKIGLKDGKPDTEDVSKIINVFDGYAAEMAIRYCETSGGEVSVATLGDEEEVRPSMVQLLAVGANHAYIGNDVAGDEAATANALSQMIAKIKEEGSGFDLILCGKESTDEISSQVGAILAEKMHLPLVTSVVGFEKTADGVKVQKETDDGYEYYLVSTPAVLTIAKPEYELRYPSIKSKMAARKAKIPTIDGLSGDSSVCLEAYEEPKMREAGIKIQEEEDADTVAKAMERLFADKVL